VADRDNPYMHEAIAKHGTKPSNGKVLILVPISGVMLRYAGTFFVMNYKSGQAQYQCPAVLLKDGEVQRIDPRALVFDDGTLARLWHPRVHLAELDPVAQRWLEDNPSYARLANLAPPPDRPVDPTDYDFSEN
jgi:hypothetical protein